MLMTYAEVILLFAALTSSAVDKNLEHISLTNFETIVVTKSQDKIKCNDTNKVIACAACNSKGFVINWIKCTNSTCRSGNVFKYTKVNGKTKLEIVKCPSCNNQDIPRNDKRLGYIVKSKKPCLYCNTELAKKEAMKNVSVVYMNPSMVDPDGLISRKYEDEIISHSDDSNKNIKYKPRYETMTCPECNGKRYVHVLTDRGAGIYDLKNYDHHNRHKTRLAKCSRCDATGKIKIETP